MSPMRRPVLTQDQWVAFLSPSLALLVTLAVGHVLVLASGESSARVFGQLLAGTWGNAYGVGQVLFKATPLVLTGLAVAIPNRAGLFNIGGEGQVVLGALTTAVVGAALPPGLPSVLAIATASSAGALAGAAWGVLPGFLKVRTGAHEVISSIMLNFVALALANWLVAGHLAMPETLHTAPITGAARLARLSSLPGGAIFAGSSANLSTVLALALVLAMAWFLLRTPAGFELRAFGANPRAATCVGISPWRVTLLAMSLGGGLAGLVGTNYVQGYKYYFEEGFSAGVGFMGIAVALVGRNHPIGLLFSALLFGTLSQGGLAINALVPKEIVDILQAVVILAMLASTAGVRALLRQEPLSSRATAGGAP